MPNWGAKRDFGYVPPVDQIMTVDAGREGRVIAITAPEAQFKRPSGLASVDDKRLGHAGGFKEFDGAAEAERRRRAAEDERQLKEARKAEKKKCEYCKRASCIC